MRPLPACYGLVARTLIPPVTAPEGLMLTVYVPAVVSVCVVRLKLLLP
jgi:hypothetical protein